MKNRYAKKAVYILSACMLIISVFHLGSIFSADNGTITLMIVGNTEDESPISGVEIEMYSAGQDGRTEKIGNYISRSDESGDGQITLQLPAGNYRYTLVGNTYEFADHKKWQDLKIEGFGNVVLVWVSPVGKDKSGKNEETEITDEKIAQAAPTENNLTPQGNFEEGAVGDHQNGKLRELQLQNSKNVLITLGVLAAIIFGIIGIDYLSNSRK